MIIEGANSLLDGVHGEMWDTMKKSAEVPQDSGVRRSYSM